MQRSAHAFSWHVSVDHRDVSVTTSWPSRAGSGRAAILSVATLTVTGAAGVSQPGRLGVLQCFFGLYLSL